jgi:ATP-dependent helicase/nuclease subunit B
MQMLIYLFALQEFGGARYGAEIEPAGVLYVPARDVILKARRNATDAEIGELRERELRRDGMILHDPEVLEAMENGDTKKYLPVKHSKDGSVQGDSLVSAAQLRLVSAHVGKMLRGAVAEMLGGGIECSPYYKNAWDNACRFCEYGAVCRFDEDMGDRQRFVRKMKMDEVWEALGNVKCKV